MKQDWIHEVGRAARVVSAGGVVGYPTETVWGLAALPDRVDRLYALKGRDPDKPVQVSCADAERARALTLGGAAFNALVGFWPGPVTLVLPASPACPPALSPGGWVGVRVPDHPVALALLRECGGILATTSLNPSGAEAARTPEQARAYALADLLLPEGAVPASGRASTVVRVWPQGGEVEVLREGVVPAALVRERLGACGVGP
ncbi:SUA5-like protein [Deinococcus aetherius]|uniref:L-threonylcarbamoyladenylate synthase n=1 Tax=Deinococcus aetherius TaxID=200252 RepID=A0ABN6REW6_9DEIO|nr:L-threonylcarbamoyladenylate synthase [Deinococcus aetherius]BDP41881.1 SUA5-like protein [Deinococcus aetherius]